MKKTISFVMAFILSASMLVTSSSAQQASLGNITITPNTIAESLSANVAVHIDGDISTIADVSIDGGDVDFAPPIASDFVLKISKAPAKGISKINFLNSEGAKLASVPIQIDPYNSSTFNIKFMADESSKLTAMFYTDIALKGEATALIGGVAYDVSQIDSRTLLIDVDAKEAEGLDFSLKGIKLSTLFPSFNFSITREIKLGEPEQEEEVQVAPLVAWYNTPAATWEDEAMPLGNGFIGAMVFGGVEKDSIMINEKTLWSGGPGANPSYNGGETGNSAQKHAALQAARQELQDNMTRFSQTSTAYIDPNTGRVVSNNYPNMSSTLTNNINSLKGTKSNFGSYQQLSNIVIDDPAPITPHVVWSESDAQPINPAEQIDKLFDGDITTKWYSMAGFSSQSQTYPLYITWKYSEPITTGSYSITSGNDTPGRDPKNWQLFGSDDGVNFTLIDERTDGAFSARRQTIQFKLSGTVTYQYFKIIVSQTLGGGTTACQMSELGMDLNIVPVFVSALIIPADREGTGTETSAKLFDSDITTKWFNNTTPTAASPTIIAWQYTAPYPTDYYKLTTGNDMQQRDPKSWTLEGSNTGLDSDFTVLDSRTGVTMGSARRATYTYNLAGEVSYKYYRLKITETYSSGSGCQLSEIALRPNGSEGTEDPYTNYRRELDLDNGMARVLFTAGGVNYKREYFVSNPGNIMVVRLTADKDGMITKRFSINSPQTRKTIIAQGDTITMEGWPADHTRAASGFSDGLRFAQQVKVIPTGGTMAADEYGYINVEGADSVLLIMTQGTNYVQCMDDTFNYFSGIDPLIAIKERIAAASGKSYDELFAEHKADYAGLMGRVKLDILGSTTAPTKTTDALLSGYARSNSVAEDRYLEMLYYQFGRHLLISSSREGSLPANLQGIWANGLNPPWDADYHTNINVQMNYWLAEQTNLTECHTPVIDYINSLVPRGTMSANFTYCRPDGGTVRGWTTHHENNIWGNTAPATSDAFYFPAGAAWLCQDIWERYAFTLDKEFLAENYDTLMGAALFWVDTLWTDTRDGKLVANPSWSPEHGPYSLGTTNDQGVAWEIFNEVINASKALGLENDPRVDEIKEAQSKLAGPQIGLAGQFMEWKDEITIDITGDGGHRHVNHLFMLHPGNQIVAGRSEQEDKFVEAMKVTLNTRGDGGTGWSKAWKINFWARLRDGDRAQKLVKEILQQSTLKNLFDTHPPFQIDGNFGSTAGMTEMLLQSQGGYVELLPALPALWKTGAVSGLKARGNVEVDIKWQDMLIKTAVLKPNVTGQIKVRGLNISSGTLTDNGKLVPFTVLDDDTIAINAVAGKSYILSNVKMPADKVKEVKIEGAAKSFVPETGSSTVQYNASVVYERMGTISGNNLVTFSLESDYTGVSISQSGLLTIGSNAGNTTIVIVAKSKDAPVTTARFTVELIDGEAISLVGVNRNAESGGSHPDDGKMHFDAGLVEYIGKGSWIKFNSVDLKSGITNMDMLFATPNTGGTIEVRIAEPGVGDVNSATTIATVALFNTGGYPMQYVKAASTSAISANSGVKDVYLYFNYPSAGFNFYKADFYIMRDR